MKDTIKKTNLLMKRFLLIIALFISSAILNSCSATSEEVKLSDIISNKLIYITNNQTNLIEKHDLTSLDYFSHDDLINEINIIKTLIKKENNNQYEFLKARVNDVRTDITLHIQPNLNNDVEHHIYINFIHYNDDNSLYYESIKINNSKTNEYRWEMNGFTLTNGNKFSIKTNLFFKTCDENNMNDIIYVQIPLNINGNVDLNKLTTNYNVSF